MTGTDPAALWRQANGDPDEYHRLMRQHGHILSPGDPGYEQGSRTLPCGWEPGKKRAEQKRCEVTDLLVDSCAHCTGRTGEPELTAADREKWGPWFAARHPGRCSAGDERIHEGDVIRADGEGGYLCADCGEDTP